MIVTETELVWLTESGIPYKIQHDGLIDPRTFEFRWVIRFNDERDQTMFVLQWR